MVNFLLFVWNLLQWRPDCELLSIYTLFLLLNPLSLIFCIIILKKKVCLSSAYSIKKKKITMLSKIASIRFAKFDTVFDRRAVS